MLVCILFTTLGFSQINRDLRSVQTDRSIGLRADISVKDGMLVFKSEDVLHKTIEQLNEAKEESTLDAFQRKYRGYVSTRTYVNKIMNVKDPNELPEKELEFIYKHYVNKEEQATDFIMPDPVLGTLVNKAGKINVAGKVHTFTIDSAENYNQGAERNAQSCLNCGKADNCTANYSNGKVKGNSKYLCFFGLKYIYGYTRHLKCKKIFKWTICWWAKAESISVSGNANIKFDVVIPGTSTTTTVTATTPTVSKTKYNSFFVYKQIWFSGINTCPWKIKNICPTSAGFVHKANGHTCYTNL